MNILLNVRRFLHAFVILIHGSLIGIGRIATSIAEDAV